MLHMHMGNKSWIEENTNCINDIHICCTTRLFMCNFVTFALVATTSGRTSKMLDVVSNQWYIDCILLKI